MAKNISAKEFLAQKGIYNLDTKKRYEEVIAWIEEYATTVNPQDVEIALMSKRIESLQGFLYELKEEFYRSGGAGAFYAIRQATINKMLALLSD